MIPSTALQSIAVAVSMPTQDRLMTRYLIDENLFTKIFNISDIFRRLDPNMPVARMEIFLLVAKNNGVISIRDLQIILNMTDAGISRNVAALKACGYQGKQGIGLLETFTDSNQRNRKLVQLSPSGRNLADMLSQLGRAESSAQATAILANVPEHNLPRSRRPARS
jgi:DNA-binding MarR family transcriptional regulator